MKNMKNRVSVTLLLLFLFLSILITAIALAIESILGYTGFKRLNYDSYGVLLRDDCKEEFFLQKYGGAREIRTQIGYIATVSASFFGVIGIFVIICYICSKKGNRNSSREDTWIQDGGDQSLKRKLYIELGCPSSTQLNALYLLGSMSALASFVPFKLYLQLWTDSSNSICPLKISTLQIGTLAVLHGLILFFSLLALLWTFSIICQVKKREQMFDLYSRSLSFRHQVEKMLREIPSSERRMYLHDRHIACPAAIPSGISEDPSPQQLQNMKQVESILYRQPFSLRLQSAVITK